MTYKTQIKNPYLTQKNKMLSWADYFRKTIKLSLSTSRSLIGAVEVYLHSFTVNVTPHSA